MFCPVGYELYEQYERAEKAKLAISATKQAAVLDGVFVTPKEMQMAKQRYVERFADWLGHKAFCQDCKPKAPSRGEFHSIAPGR